MSITRPFRRFSEAAYRSERLAKLLFGVDCLPLGPEDYYFDVSSIAFFQILASRLTQQNKVLDMGTGAAAILALALHRKISCPAAACDINPDLVKLASPA
jgi:tRNA1(Val) A37 N6-methylase TrmN6